MNVPDPAFVIVIVGNVDGNPNKGEVYALVEGEELRHHEFEWNAPSEGPGGFQTAHASAEAAARRTVDNPQIVKFDDCVVEVGGQRRCIWNILPDVPGDKDIWDALSPEARKLLTGAGS